MLVASCVVDGHPLSVFKTLITHNLDPRDNSCVVKGEGRSSDGRGHQKLLCLKVDREWSEGVGHTCRTPDGGYLRSVSPPLEARRLGFVLDADILRCTPRCVGLCTWGLPGGTTSLPAMLRNDRDDPDREPSDSDCGAHFGCDAK